MRFDSGDLKPLRDVVNSMGPPLGTTGADIGTLFFYRNSRIDFEAILPFGWALTVTGARSPVPNDSYARWYWCVGGSGVRAITFDWSGGYPNPNPVGSGFSYQPHGGYRLGVPAPQVAPEIAAIEDTTGRVGWDTGISIQSIARTNPITVNTSSEPPFANGQRVRFRVNPSYPKPGEEEEGSDGPPPETPPEPGEGDGQVWSLDGLEGVVANVGPSSFDVFGVSATQFADFTEDDLAALQIKRYLVDDDLESRNYVFTYVTEFDEEGPPSPPSNIVDVMKEGVVQVGMSDIPHNQSQHGGSRDFVNRIRIYRAVASETSLIYALVGTLNFTGGASPDSEAEWVSAPSPQTPETEWTGIARDAVPSVSLGEPIPSVNWFPPPNGLRGIVLLPNGIMCGWEGNTVSFTEPSLPHAWPSAYSVTLDDDVVGAESFGNSLVVGTNGRPYLVSGVDSASMVAKKMDHHAPLLGPGLITDAGSGVVYASDVGLMLVGPGGSRLMTPQFTKEAWRTFVGTRTKLTFFDNYVLMYGGGNPVSVFSLVGDRVEVADIDVDFNAATRMRSALAIVTRQTGAPNQPYRILEYFNAAEDSLGQAVRLSALFRSGLLAIRKPCNFSVAQVFADAYPVTVTVRSIRPGSYPDPVAGQPDLAVLHERDYEVLGPEPFRLQAGYLSREYEIEISTSYRVQSVALATSLDELRQEQG